MAKKTPKSAPKYQQLIISAAIAIVLVAFIMYSLHLIYPSPEYSDFCPERLRIPLPETEETCSAEGGRWQPNNAPCVEPKCPQGWCEYDYQCRNDFEEARKPYERNTFLIIASTGVTLIILALLLKLAAVSGGIGVGGLILLIIAVVGYWDKFGEYVRLLLLGLLLAALIFIAYKRFGGK